MGMNIDIDLQKHYTPIAFIVFIKGKQLSFLQSSGCTDNEKLIISRYS